MILPAQHIRARKGMIEPFEERGVVNGMSYGLSVAGYDVRIDKGRTLRPGEFCLASTLERFVIPNDLQPHVYDKSTWARQGLHAFTTTLEPGWSGWLTLELVNHGPEIIRIPDGCPIVQIVFALLAEPTENPYRGKYNNQPDRPVAAIMETAFNAAGAGNGRGI